MRSSARGKGRTDVRVALLTNSLSPHTLPFCEQIHRHIRELRAFVSAATDEFHDFPQPRASFAIVVQQSFNRLRLPYRSSFFSVSEEVHLPLDTLSQLLRYRPEVIVSSQLGARTFLAMLYKLFRPRVRLIVWAALSAHTERERGVLRRALRRFMLGRVDGLFVNGKSGEKYLRQLGYRGDACFVPYAIDDTLFRGSSYAPKADERRLLFCGRIDATKGILRFCQTLHRWCAAHPERRIHFTMIGNGPDTAAIQALPALPSLTLEVLPRMAQEALAEHYKQADLFAFPSLMDEWGVVVNEAMSAGLPVLGSIYSQAVAELVADGHNGWVFDPRKEEDLLGLLDRVLATPPDELDCMSAYAQCTARELSPEIVADRALAYIETLCGLGQKQKPRVLPDLQLAPPTAVPVP